MSKLLEKILQRRHLLFTSWSPQDSVNIILYVTAEVEEFPNAKESSDEIMFQEKKGKKYKLKQTGDASASWCEL